MGFCIAKEHRLLPQSANPITASAAIVPSVLLDSKCQTDIQKFYQFKKVLGHGQFGTVRQAVLIGTPRQVAIKSISKEKVKKDLHLLRRELEVMRLIDHPNLIKYFETYEDEKYMHIVMELCTGGDLLDKLIFQGSLTESMVSSIMQSLLLAVNHLHGMSICHRDLKPENFLFTNKTKDAVIKIIDFGMSVKQIAVSELSSLVGTPYYLAPEVLRGKYGNECDVWSLGVVMYLMLSGSQPFDGEDMKEIFGNIRKCQYNFEDVEWMHVSDDAKDLIQRMLTKHPSERITVKEALRHPWFATQLEQTPHIVPSSVLRSMKQFKAPKKLQQEVMKVMIKFMSTEEIEELRMSFLELDQGQTGFITFADLELAMEKAGFNVQAEEVKSKT